MDAEHSTVELGVVTHSGAFTRNRMREADVGSPSADTDRAISDHRISRPSLIWPRGSQPLMENLEGSNRSSRWHWHQPRKGRCARTLLQTEGVRNRRARHQHGEYIVPRPVALEAAVEPYYVAADGLHFADRRAEMLWRAPPVCSLRHDCPLSMRDRASRIALRTARLAPCGGSMFIQHFGISGSCFACEAII